MKILSYKDNNYTNISKIFFYINKILIIINKNQYSNLKIINKIEFIITKVIINNNAFKFKII